MYEEYCCVCHYDNNPSQKICHMYCHMSNLETLFTTPCMSHVKYLVTDCKTPCLLHKKNPKCKFKIKLLVSI